MSDDDRNNRGDSRHQPSLDSLSTDIWSKYFILIPPESKKKTTKKERNTWKKERMSFNSGTTFGSVHQLLNDKFDGATLKYDLFVWDKKGLIEINEEDEDPENVFRKVSEIYIKAPANQDNRNITDSDTPKTQTCSLDDSQSSVKAGQDGFKVNTTATFQLDPNITGEMEDQYNSDDLGAFENHNLEDLDTASQNDEGVPFYPMQTSIGQMILERIENIIELCHQKTLSEFKDFEFQIYTAKFTMLQQQTMKRLMDKMATCFSPTIYANEKLLRTHAGNRVHMYSPGEHVTKRKDELRKEAKNNPNRLYLIVADEAHWGVGKCTEDNMDESVPSNQQPNKKGVHDQVINCWDDSYPNVFVLQVTATPFNVKNTRSRLNYKQLYLEYESEISKPKESPLKSGKCMEGKYQLAKKVAANYYNVVDSNKHRLHVTDKRIKSAKQLHNIRWAEGHQDKYKKGILARLRIPNQQGKPPIFIKEINQDIIKPAISLKVDFTQQDVQAMDLHLSGTSSGCVTILTPCKQYQLVLFKENNTVEARFVGCDHLQLKQKSKEIISRTFHVLSDFGEDVIVLKTDNASHPYIRYDEKSGCLTTGRRPADNIDKCLDKASVRPVVPYLEYSFIVDYWRLEDGPCQQYLSLNFYFNTMRNANETDQLIRGDADFRECAKFFDGAHTGKKSLSKKALSDALSSEYAYFLLLNNEMYSCTINSANLDEFFGEFESSAGTYVDKCRDLLQNLQGELNKPEKISTFGHYLEYLQSLAKTTIGIIGKNLEQLIKNGSKAPLPKEAIDELFRDSTRILLLNGEGKSEIFNKFLKRIKATPQLYKQMKEHFLSFKGSFNSIKEQLLEEMETYKLVKKVCRESKFVVVRTGDKNAGNAFYATLTKARKLSSKLPAFTYEIVRDFGNFKVEEVSERDSKNPKFRIHRRLQPNQCQHQSGKTHESCDCENYYPEEESLICSNCKHVHKRIKDYHDCQNLPCVLILVNKGRLGDTFPKNFAALDQRQFYQHDKVIYLSTLMQEFGRLCRYSYKPGQEIPETGYIVEYSNLPYVLVGESLVKTFKESLEKYAVFHGYFAEKGRLDRYIEVGKSGNVDTEEDLIPTSNSFDHDNNEKHTNRILLEAEPQVGKTGAYLYVISQLRKKLTSAHDSSDEEQDYDSEYDGLTSDEDEVSSETKEHKIRKFTKEQLGGEQWHHPGYYTMQSLKPPKHTLAQSKYDRTRGSEFRPKSGIADKKTQKHQPIILESLSNDQFRSFNSGHHLFCRECQSQTQEKPIVQQVSLSGMGKIMVSVPYLERYKEAQHKINDLVDDSVANDVDVVDDTDQLSSWVFTPSYRRVNSAMVNLSHTMVCIDEKSSKKSTCRYIQFLVVRTEEFKEYRRVWGHSHGIISIPKTINGTQKNPNTGGIGYARLFIQRLAKFLNLKYIFMIDDNVTSFHEIITEDTGDNETLVTDKGRVKTKSAPMFRVLKHLEHLFLKERECHNKVARLMTSNPSNKRAPDTDTMENNSLACYTGRSDNYVAVGCLRDRGFSVGVNPFNKSHPCSVFLLNITPLRKMNIEFKPDISFEDIDFFQQCHSHSKPEKPVWVAKYKRFIFRKVQMRSEIKQDLYTWPYTDVLHLSQQQINGQDAKREKQTIKSWIRKENCPQFVKHLRGDSTKSLIAASELEWMSSFDGMSTGGAGSSLIFQVDLKQTPAALIHNLHEARCLIGIQKHVLVFSADYCHKHSLTSCLEFKTCIVRSGFMEDASFSVLSAFNIIRYNVNYILLEINGSILDFLPKTINCQASSGNEEPTEKMSSAFPKIDVSCSNGEWGDAWIQQFQELVPYLTMDHRRQMDSAIEELKVKVSLSTLPQEIALGPGTSGTPSKGESVNTTIEIAASPKNTMIASPRNTQYNFKSTEGAYSRGSLLKRNTQVDLGTPTGPAPIHDRQLQGQHDSSYIKRKIIQQESGNDKPVKKTNDASQIKKIRLDQMQ